MKSVNGIFSITLYITTAPKYRELTFEFIPAENLEKTQRTELEEIFFGNIQVTYYYYASGGSLGLH